MSEPRTFEFEGEQWSAVATGRSHDSKGVIRIGVKLTQTATGRQLYVWIPATNLHELTPEQLTEAVKLGLAAADDEDGAK